MGWAGIKKKLFGDYIEIVIHGADKKRSHKILKAAYKESLRLQKIFNLYDKSSELNKLNYKRGIKASDELLEVINSALVACRQSDGFYDISLGKNFIRRKWKEKLEDIKCSYKDILVNGKNIELSNKDVIVDLGSIAKGYIADKVGEFIKKEGINDFIIDARGDILVSGEGKPAVRIQNPRGEGFIMTLRPKDSGIATSGDYEQYDSVFENSHILNRNENVSVTVIAPTLAEADLYATVFSVIDKKKIKAILDKNKGLSVLTIDKKMNKEYYNKFKEKVDHG